MKEMKIYKGMFQNHDGYNTQDIPGYRCLQEEYPDLFLFVGEYCCPDMVNGKRCDYGCEDDDEDGCLDICIEYAVNEGTSGRLATRKHPTPAEAIEELKWRIKTIGLEKFQSIIATARAENAAHQFPEPLNT